MAAVSVTLADLAPFAVIDDTKAAAMIVDAMALAARVAPCILTVDFAYPEAALAIIRGAILRWHEAGTGALSQQSAGPFMQTVDNRQPRRGMFWPSEINDLQELCSTSGAAGAFTIDTALAVSGHAEACAINFGALYCSCGYDLAGYPLWP